MRNKGTKLLLFIFFISILGYSQDQQSLFRPPLSIPLELSGGFGDLRNNHIHAGYDFRTQKVTGKQVFAIGNGYLSRIKIESGGYGKAIYIDHPEGYTSVYAHLESFNAIIDSLAKAEQYKLESFAIDLMIPKNLIKIEKGMFIGLSGNSGSSGGPHLHFEMRDLKTQEPINLCPFKLVPVDKKPPVIQNIHLYQISNKAINNDLLSYSVSVKKMGTEYTLSKNDTLQINGTVGLGLEAYDPQINSITKHGLYNVEVQLDDQPIFGYKIDRFAFAESRYVNSLKDYAMYKKKGRKIMKLYIEPNNKLSTYSHYPKRGLITLTDTLPHRVKIMASDCYGNQSVLSFHIRNKPAPPSKLVIFNKPDTLVQLNCFVRNIIQKGDVIVDIPKESLYSHFQLACTSYSDPAHRYSRVHVIGNENIPLHRNISLSIKTDSISKNLINKALIISIGKGNKISAVGGNWSNGFITAYTRSLGIFSVALDTIPPTINPVNFKSGDNLKAKNGLVFKINDNLSGIKSYRGTIDEKWVLFEFDAKSGTLFYLFETARITTGKNHDVIVTVTDEKNNITTYRSVFFK